MTVILWKSFLGPKIFRYLPSCVTLHKKYSYLKNWEEPQGYDSGITVYNSVINKKVPLILKNKGSATWYVCGPTVYAESHIGHASCYVKFDIIKRIMENIFNVNVFLLMGITDIDDKIIKKSKEIGVSASEIAKRYEFEFFQDMAAMNAQTPNAVSRVTENISLIISFCEALIKKDFAYVTTEGNVYFVVSKSSSADMIMKMPDDSQVLMDPLKKDNRDFALWKSAKPDEPYWLSPWGKGRPGWHIECSAMASDIFGSQLDIHAGGYDLIFPHHINEESQSVAYHGCSQWVNYWLHSGLLHMKDDVKMSKSIQNTISIKDFLKNNSVDDFRILCLQSLYRKNILFCAETLDGAKSLHSKFHNFVNECELYVYGKVRIPLEYERILTSKLEATRERVVSFLADDFNTSQALLCLTDLIDEVNNALQSSSNTFSSEMEGVTVVAFCSNYVNNILETFGISIICKKKLRREFTHFIDVIVEFRFIIRLFALCQIEEGDHFASQYIIESFKKVVEANNHVSQLKESTQIIEDIKGAVNLFYNQSLDFVSTDLADLEKSSEKMNLKAERKKRKHLLSLCDNLRSTLQEHGVAIKDQRDGSTWYPLMKLQL